MQKFLNKYGIYILAGLVLAVAGYAVSDYTVEYTRTDDADVQDTQEIQQLQQYLDTLETELSKLQTQVAEQQEQQQLGSFETVGGQVYYLSGGGVSSTQSTITLTSFDIPVSGDNLTMSHFGNDIGYMTLEPGNSDRQEFISFTSVTQNSDGTATLGGVTRGLAPVTPFTASSTYQKAHPGGSAAVLSNPPQLYNQFGVLSNDESITGTWTTIDPTAANQIAHKSYVDDNVNGGAVTLDSISVAGDAGDSYATGTVVYLDKSDQEWKKADANATSTSISAQIGIAQGAGTDGETINGGVRIRGLDRTQSNMSPGDIIYVSDTAGATSTTPGTFNAVLGVARTSDQLYIDPLGEGNNIVRKDIINTFTNKTFFNGTTTFNGNVTGTASSSDVYFKSDGTWNKPDNLSYVVVEMVGGGEDGGGVGGAFNDETEDGGAGAGYARVLIDEADLSSTVQVTVGSAGSFTSATTTGTTTSAFGDIASSTGEGADFSISGQRGGVRHENSDDTGQDEYIGGAGGDSFFGSGGMELHEIDPGTVIRDGRDGRGFGTGGSGCIVANGSGDSCTGGSGAPGIVIIHEFY